MTAACTRPVRGSDPGWPRPRLLCTADVHNHDHGYRCSTTCPMKSEKTRPVPWLAEQDHSAWDPWEFDQDRSVALRDDNLCQVCGCPRGGEVYVLVWDYDRRKPDPLVRVEMFGGSLCSLRCARLTAAVCPRYAEHGPVDVYRVPAADRCDIVGCGEDNDDEVDLNGPGCVLVDTVGRAS